MVKKHGILNLNTEWFLIIIHIPVSLQKKGIKMIKILVNIMLLEANVKERERKTK